jgi:hypothetical protein
MSGVVRVEIARFSATITGGGRRLRGAIELTGARWMAHPTRKHRSGSVQVHRDDADDVIAALEADGVPVKIVAAAERPDSRRTGAGQRQCPGVTRDGEIGGRR